jgi:hypothetical protein
LTKVESYVIDANVVKAVFETQMGHVRSVSADPAPVVDNLKRDFCRIVIDEGEQILQEWKDCVDPDWFVNWFFELTSGWNVVVIEPRLCNDVLKKLYTECGFPRAENKWLIRTAITEAGATGACALLSEDMDFREPRMKNAKGRERYIEGTIRGSVTKLLGKHDVRVVSLLQCS